MARQSLTCSTFQCGCYRIRTGLHYLFVLFQIRPKICPRCYSMLHDLNCLPKRQFHSISAWLLVTTSTHNITSIMLMQVHLLPSASESAARSTKNAQSASHVCTHLECIDLIGYCLLKADKYKSPHHTLPTSHSDEHMYGAVRQCRL